MYFLTMSSPYDYRRIEKKWHRIWEDKGVFRAEIDPLKPKFYILDMFPYPSGSGLHVGHVVGYTVTDILARYLRTKGYNVLHPIGWDSFGLPAEQYAIRTGVHPAITTEQNINTYRRQLKRLGFSYDWSREITTSDPSYYKWTQWIFTKLYEKGLAYEAHIPVNFCPALGTVLSNEEVDQGRSKEGGYPIERRPLRQWVLKITEYADRLIEDLDLVDWSESLKQIQVNWIGKSSGMRIDFREEGGEHLFPIYTTRPETIFGTTFLVLSPEHPLIDEITHPSQRDAVKRYQKRVNSKSERERLIEEKSGVSTGAYAINPVNHQKIPVWIADYVLMGYGTGIVMAVPAHDEKDFEFAKKFELPIKEVIQQSGLNEKEGEKLINSSFLNDLFVAEARKKIIQWLLKEGKGKEAVHYKLRDWLFSRQRYWGEPIPILHFEDGSKRTLEIDELPLGPPELKNYHPSSSGEIPFAREKTWMEIIDPKTGKKAFREASTMPQWAGSCWYYLRFCDPQNNDKAWDPIKERYWLPVDLYVGGAEHAVLHLLYARFWHKVLYDCGLVSSLEPFKKLKNQGLITARSYQLPTGTYLSSEEVIEKEGRFYQIGSGIELRSQIEKMSKSKLNGVTPDQIIEEYGADSLRLYEMFMGPFDQEKLWNTDAVQGCFRFLNRFYGLVTSNKVSDEVTEEALRLGHRTVFYVERDLQEMSFNTAIAKLMEFTNSFSSLSRYPKKVLKMITQLLYPLAPHIAEEAWEILGETESLAYTPFPVPDQTYLIDPTVLYVIQVNGRVRGKWELPRDRTQEEVLAFVRDKPEILRHLSNPIKKVIFVPNKLINLVN